MAWAAPATGEPVWFGVSGPLTGQNAQYGAQWKAGFDLALEDINAKGGIHGRPLAQPPDALAGGSRGCRPAERPR